jgi:lycopene cyclase domain-containing protein
VTYFDFLLRFIGIPIALILVLLAWTRRRGRRLPVYLRDLPGWLAIVVHIVLAVVWTTPWDNYLVATNVWWYDPRLVTGTTLGWVPIEEYTFFVVQTIMTGAWLLWLGHVLRPAPWPPPRRPGLRLGLSAALGIVWLAALGMVLAGWRPGTYLALELGWMLPPIILQIAAGGDILWHQRRLVSAALLPPIAYLALADALAIGSGTWTIDPVQSLPLLLGGILPVEELVFFGLTNTLIVFGMTLLMSYRTVLVRLKADRAAFQRARQGPKPT